MATVPIQLTIGGALTLADSHTNPATSCSARQNAAAGSSSAPSSLKDRRISTVSPGGGESKAELATQLYRLRYFVLAVKNGV
ncbi:hypothetical protein PpBr36_09033 [Pyricularia pennisetigena]|uniref:hypothetical protein n=1 Tax=Pyricularia pennisetigena TaxID=1578925 RepID=UPI001151FE7D|nr:hypothetical protein PpBr36_09033 [Pyricularia pennisetigena]TLS23818.1 hypothetical protein PpBr36_09033 [Pyricularia pennisetigena]